MFAELARHQQSEIAVLQRRKQILLSVATAPVGQNTPRTPTFLCVFVDYTFILPLYLIESRLLMRPNLKNLKAWPKCDLAVEG